MNWDAGLDDFLVRFDAVAAELLTEHHRDGCVDLPRQNLAMGPRYSVQGFDIPLSVFRGEGVVLWALVREFGPKWVVETYTGTGVAACFMAAARDVRWPCVRTLDHYGEGGMGDAGWLHVQEMSKRLGTTLNLHRGALHAFDREFSGIPWDFQFADGCHPPAFDARLTVHHDEPGGISHSFQVPGTSYMTVQAYDPADLVRAHAAAGRALTWLEAHR